MRTDFSPIFFRDNDTPWGAIAGGITGLGQTILGAAREGKYTKKAEKLIQGYQPNASIMDYYTKALNRYNVNPYRSSIFNYMKQQAGAATAQGIEAFQDRRSANANIGALIQGQNDAMLKAAATAEGQQSQALGQLGQATQMKAAEDKYKFENLANLYLSKAGGGAKIMNAGMSNIFGTLNTLDQMKLLKGLYGDNSVMSSGGGYDYENSPYWKRRTGQ